MTAFATEQELRLFMGRTLKPGLASMMLAQASSAIRSFCGWHIAPSETETLTLDGTGARSLSLPSLHVTAVSKVQVNGEEIRDFTWSEAGILWRESLWPSGLRSVEVSLTHGYASVPDDIKSVCLQMAARTVSAPAGVRYEQTGAVSVGYGAADGVAGYEQQVLKRYTVAGAC